MKTHLVQGVGNSSSLEIAGKFIHEGVVFTGIGQRRVCIVPLDIIQDTAR